MAGFTRPGTSRAAGCARRAPGARLPLETNAGPGCRRRRRISATSPDREEGHEGRRSHRGNHEARGHRDPLRLSGEPSDRICGSRGYPPDHGAPGTHRPAHGRCDLAHHLGRKIGAFCMQHGPGTENAYGGVAQAYGESVPILVVPVGYPRRIAHIDAQLQLALAQMRGITKIGRADHRRRRGAERHAPRLHAACATAVAARCWSRCPTDMWNEELPEPLDYTPVPPPRYGPDPAAVTRGGRDAGQGEASGDLCRHRACTGRRPGSS